MPRASQLDSKITSNNASVGRFGSIEKAPLAYLSIQTEANGPNPQWTLRQRQAGADHCQHRQGKKMTRRRNQKRRLNADREDGF